MSEETKARLPKGTRMYVKQLEKAQERRAELVAKKAALDSEIAGLDTVIAATNQLLGRETPKS